MTSIRSLPPSDNASRAAVATSRTTVSTVPSLGSVTAAYACAAALSRPVVSQ